MPAGHCTGGWDDPGMNSLRGRAPLLCAYYAYVCRQMLELARLMCVGGWAPVYVSRQMWELDICLGV